MEKRLRLPLAFACAALLSCSGGGAARVAYDRSQELFRAGGYDPGAVTRVVVLPVAELELENIEGIGPARDWRVRAQEHLLAALARREIQAEPLAAEPMGYRDVVEGYLDAALGAKEAALFEQAPVEAKTYLATKEKIYELSPREWARKWEEFARTFSANPFAPLALERAAALQLLPPHYPAEDIARAAATGATHIVVPSELKWVRSKTNIGGVPHEVFAAQLSLELIEAKSGQVVWRGHGIHKMDDQVEDPLDSSAARAALHVVDSAMSR